MINLATTDKLRIESSAAANLDCLCTGADLDTDTTPDTIMPFSHPLNHAAASTVDLCPGPTTPYDWRNAVDVSVRNKHVTQATDVAIIFDRSGTPYEITKTALFPGWELAYVDKLGRFVSKPTLDHPFFFKKALAANVSTAADTNPVTLTGLVFSFEANAKYIIEIFANMQSPAATTGYGIQFDVSVAVTDIGFTFFHQLANTGTLSGGSSITDDASVGVSSGVPSAATDTPLYGSGILVAAGSAGTAQARLRSETTAVATMIAGSMMRVMRVE